MKRPAKVNRETIKTLTTGSQESLQFHNCGISSLSQLMLRIQVPNLWKRDPDPSVLASQIHRLQLAYDANNKSRSSSLLFHLTGLIIAEQMITKDEFRKRVCKSSFHQIKPHHKCTHQKMENLVNSRRRN